MDFITLVNDSNFYQSYIEINVTLIESNLDNITFTLLNRHKQLINNVTYNNLTTSHTFSNLEIDIGYIINVSAYDRSGNYNTSQTLTINLLSGVS